MDIDRIEARFAALAGRKPGELTAYRFLCSDAMAEIARRADPGKQGGGEILGAAAAALAYFRYTLLELTGAAEPGLGHTALADGETIEAAAGLLGQYMAAAAPFLLPSGMFFGQVTA